MLPKDAVAVVAVTANKTNNTVEDIILAARRRAGLVPIEAALVDGAAITEVATRKKKRSAAPMALPVTIPTLDVTLPTTRHMTLDIADVVRTDETVVTKSNKKAVPENLKVNWIQCDRCDAWRKVPAEWTNRQTIQFLL